MKEKNLDIKNKKYRSRYTKKSQKMNSKKSEIEYLVYRM